MLQQHRLDLAEFDAEAAQFDLVINPPEKLDVPVGQISSDVSGSVSRAPATVLNG